MEKKDFYTSPQVVLFEMYAEDAFLAISIDGNIKDMDEEGGDYDD